MFKAVSTGVAVRFETASASSGQLIFEFDEPIPSALCAQIEGSFLPAIELLGYTPDVEPSQLAPDSRSCVVTLHWR